MGGVNLGVDTIETARLVGERMRREHLRDLCALHRDKRVMATLAGVRSDAESKLWVKRMATHWDLHGYGIWMFYDKTDRRFVARGGLRKLHVGGRDEVELAYAVMADHWRRGIATEVGREALRVGFDAVGLEEIVAFTQPHNTGSRGVMEKLGFIYERDIVHAELPHVLYRLTAEEFFHR